jgi:RNA polymerase sigma factor (sigma-70 family)
MRDLSALTDQELVVQTVEGESAAYGCLYDRYVDQVYRYIFFKVNDRQDAEDITEAAFIKTLETITQRQTTITSFKAWLYRSVKNLVIDYYRSKNLIFPWISWAIWVMGNPHRKASRSTMRSGAA